MIELIFAIVVVAIVMLTVPMIIRVMNQSQELSLGQELFAKMYAQAQRKSMNPWDWGVSSIVLNPNDTNGTILMVGSTDLNCSRSVGLSVYRDNNISTRECNQVIAASAIPAHDGNLSGMWGIEQYNDESYTVHDPINGDYTVTIMVSYADDGDDWTVAGHTGHYATVWTLGDDASPSGAGTTVSHLKRIVMKYEKSGLPTSTFTFFMSNIGAVQ